MLHLPRQVRFYATAGVPVPSFTKRNALVLEHLDTYIVGVDGRHRKAHADGFDGFTEQGIRVLGNAVGHGHVRFLETNIFRGLNHHVTQFVAGVVAILVNTAAARLDRNAVAGGILSCNFILEKGHFSHFDPQAVKKFLSIVIREDSRFLVFLIVRIKVLIESAQVIARSILFHEAGIFIGNDALAGFIEGAGRIFRYVAGDFSNL